MDNTCVKIIYDNGSMVSLYTPIIEESLRTTVYSRSKLDWLINNEPSEYARMVLDCIMQDYIYSLDSIARQQNKTILNGLRFGFHQA